jgi:AcrR family transcriptional regulator
VGGRFYSIIMGIAERREREREQRRTDIIRSAWDVAEEAGWGVFSVEKVAAQAELGRATIYGYFESLEALLETMATQAVEELSSRVAKTEDLPGALDVPVRFSQERPAAFALLFPPPSLSLKPPFDCTALTALRQEAQAILGRLSRLASKGGATLPADAREAAAFVAGISLAAAVIPDLRASTPLRRRWQDFCLGLTGAERPEPTAATDPGDDADQGSR